MLLLLLAIAAVPGSLVPQRGVDARAVETYFLDHPTSAPILDNLGFFSVYSSPWFSAVYLLLMVSLIGCILPRSFVYYRAARARPPKAPRNFSRLPASTSFETDASPDEVVAAARKALGRSRIDVVDARRRARGQRREGLPARGRQPGVPRQHRRGPDRRRGRHAVRLPRLGHRDRRGRPVRQHPAAVRRVQLRRPVRQRRPAAVRVHARRGHRAVPALRQPAGRRAARVPGRGHVQRRSPATTRSRSTSRSTTRSRSAARRSTCWARATRRSSRSPTRRATSCSTTPCRSCRPTRPTRPTASSRCPMRSPSSWASRASSCRPRSRRAARSCRSRHIPAAANPLRRAQRVARRPRPGRRAAAVGVHPRQDQHAAVQDRRDGNFRVEPAARA